MHSYSLDAIAEYELSERKVQYEGTLDQLYNQDFRKFIDYNRQDTMILARLDEKLKFLDLANELAHANTVLLQTTMGAVAVTEQAIINEAHERGMVVPDRKQHDRDDVQAAEIRISRGRDQLLDRHALPPGAAAVSRLPSARPAAADPQPLPVQPPEAGTDAAEL